MSDNRTGPTIYPGASWERVPSPEALGWSRDRLQVAREYTANMDTTAVMVVVGGRVVDDWGETATRSNVHSVRKSFLSALYGRPVRDGLINLSATLEELGIDDNEPSLTAEEKMATVSDLLKARSGVYHVALYETDAMRAARPPRGSHGPGTFWYYNNWDFNALGTIFEHQTGAGIFEAFAEHIAQPIGMQDFRIEDGSYFTGPESVHPAYPFRMTARDMARFGLLFLREGAWCGREVIPRDWVRESTTAHSSVPGTGGYGYMWWVITQEKGAAVPEHPDGSYGAAGNHGQYIHIVPALDLVVVHRVNTDIEGRDVKGREWLEILRLILAAAPDYA